MIWGADVVSFGVQNVSSSMPVASTLAPWGIFERSRGIWEHKNGDIQAWISVDLGRIWGLHVMICWQPLEQHVCLCARLFPDDVFLMISGFDCPRLQNQVFGVRHLAQTTFHMYWDSVDLGVIFECFLIALGLILVTFGAL